MLSTGATIDGREYLDLVVTELVGALLNEREGRYRNCGSVDPASALCRGNPLPAMPASLFEQWADKAVLAFKREG